MWLDDWPEVLSMHPAKGKSLRNLPNMTFFILLPSALICLSIWDQDSLVLCRQQDLELR